jgi:tetratricopeptide (TPR) repeat protein
MLQMQPDGEETLSTALHFAERSGVTWIEATVAYNLAVSVLALPQSEDLDRGEQLIRRALELLSEDDELQRSKCFGELGFIAFRRAREAATRGDQATIERQIGLSIAAYERGMELTPANAKESLAAKHVNLGTIYRFGGYEAEARRHFEQSITLADQIGRTDTAGLARAKIAELLDDNGQPDEAALYAARALKDLEPLGSAAAAAAPVASLREMLTRIGQENQS